jgi:hypothetical protein
MGARGGFSMTLLLVFKVGDICFCFLIVSLESGSQTADYEQSVLELTVDFKDGFSSQNILYLLSHFF